MKRLWLNIKLFFASLAFGMKSADKILTTAATKDNSDGVGIEEEKQDRNVYKDLLKGEVTQEVKELRHEMYYAERKSHDYEYVGNGVVGKKKNMFQYNGDVYNEDGLRVLVVQENTEDMSSLIENEIYCVGKDVEYGEKAQRDFSTKDKRDFTLRINRDFMPSFRLEQYTNKIVVKSFDDKRVMLDFYVSQYKKQFDNTSKLFVSAVEKIYEGDKRSDIIDIDNVSFVTYRAYGSDDLKCFKYKNLKFDNIVKYDGSYVLQFIAEVEENGTDLIAEFFDEIANTKSRNHEARDKNRVISLEAAAEIMAQDSYDVEQAINLAAELENNG